MCADNLDNGPFCPATNDPATSGCCHIRDRESASTPWITRIIEHKRSGHSREFPGSSYEPSASTAKSGSDRLCHRASLTELIKVDPVLANRFWIHFRERMQSIE